MGLYSINCPSCSKAHVWFSGSMDQRCESCKAPREYSIKMKNDGTSEGWIYPMDPTKESVNPISGCQVIEKSAFDFQCKQVEDMAKQFNETCQYYMKLVNDLNNQLSIEKAEVSRLLAFNKRARTRKKKD